MKRQFGKLAMLLVLGACSHASGDRIYDAQGRSAAGGEFGEALYAGYLGLSRSELAEKDRPDADYFAEKAISTAINGDVDPESLANRHIKDKYRAEASGLYSRLIEVRGTDARATAPKELARAQIMFDCYMQEREENFQPDHIRACLEGFEVALSDVERVAHAPAPTTPPAVPTPPVEMERPSMESPDMEQPQMPAPTGPKAFTIYFDFDSASLDDDALGVLAEVLAELDLRGDVAIRVDGHADRSGPDDYNEALSARRAEAVISYLVASGVHRDRITEEAHGERDPAVVTADGVRERRNRRAHVIMN